jgi:hypothetical protein
MKNHQALGNIANFRFSDRGCFARVLAAKKLIFRASSSRVKQTEIEKKQYLG